MSETAIEYKRRDITVDDYHRMDDAGIFHPDERVELIDGELIEMAPLGLSHWSRHATLNRYFVNRSGDRAFVVPRGSFPLRRRNEPQPDFAILANIDYASRNERPTLEEIYAFVEVANTSAAFDRGRKMRMYGQQRVREHLLVGVKHNRLTLFSGSNEVGYADSRELTYGDSFAFAALPDLTLSADVFLNGRA